MAWKEVNGSRSRGSVGKETFFTITCNEPLSRLSSRPLDPLDPSTTSIHIHIGRIKIPENRCRAGQVTRHFLRFDFEPSCWSVSHQSPKICGKRPATRHHVVVTG